jgi:hypothetical protein
MIQMIAAKTIAYPKITKGRETAEYLVLKKAPTRKMSTPESSKTRGHFKKYKAFMLLIRCTNLLN